MKKITAVSSYQFFTVTTANFRNFEGQGAPRTMVSTLDAFAGQGPPRVIFFTRMLSTERQHTTSRKENKIMRNLKSKYLENYIFLN